MDQDLSHSLKCKPCHCNPAGTSGSPHECHPVTGMCRCLSDVSGRDCGQCEPGFFNLRPGNGCERCNCNPIGSSSPACHPITGQCVCRVGVQGTSCDACRLGFFGFSSRGCRACNCDPMGSVSMQCHSNGTCPCRQGFVGYKCDKCEMNYFHNRHTHQCEECPVCYSLIRDQAVQLKAKMKALEKVLAHYDCRSMPRRPMYRYHNPLHQPHGHPQQHGHEQQHGRERHGHEQPHGHERHGHEQPHVHQQHVHEERERSQLWRSNLVQEYRDQDYLPNSIEDFLAIQEAREAFIKQFSQLETSAQTLELHLRSVATVMNCSLREQKGGMEVEKEEGERKNEGRATEECEPLMETYGAVRGVLTQLEQATRDLGNMVIPFSIPKGPNEWNAAVNESQILAESHVEAAGRMESIASEALRVSNQTYSLLLTLLEDNSTEHYIQGLLQRLSDLQQLKGNLSSQVNESLEAHLSLEEQQVEVEAILKNISSSMSEQRAHTHTHTHTHTNGSSISMPVGESNLNASQVNVTADDTLLGAQVQSLEERSSELTEQVQSREDLVIKTREELESRITQGENNIKTIQEFQQLTDLAEGLKVASLSSVVKAKEVESEASALQRNLEGMQKKWPRLQTQTKMAVQRAQLVEDKPLAEAKKKVKVAERLLRVAVDNATQANITAVQAEDSAHAVSKNAKATRTQTKQAKRASAQLRSSVEETGLKLSEPERIVTQMLSQMQTQTDEPEASLGSVMKKMESAKLQLESYTHTLAQLLSKLEEDTSLESFDHILNETASRLLLLRRSVESPSLSGKIQTLKTAAHEQKNQMSRLDQSLQEIREERASLQDIVLTLPKSCP
ncbi:laminin subunit gamma-1-like [Sardina pilchardus]|uniref:laminin subunit gamma-1-like n=1 Tax=Sardina pilchardus TaxID=27697 RepID=UPI002E128C3D